jgi:hypothetical protein
VLLACKEFWKVADVVLPAILDEGLVDLIAEIRDYFGLPTILLLVVWGLEANMLFLGEKAI